MGYSPLREYAAVGNDDRIALVDTDGSIDWLCFPHVAGPSVFGRLLDDERGGHFAVRPTDTYESEHAYRGNTNVLETTFETRSGRATLTDFMPVIAADRQPGTAGADDRSAGEPGADFQQSLYRRLDCEEGPMVLEVDYRPRFGYAEDETTVGRTDGRIEATAGDERLALQVHGPLDLETGERHAYGATRLEADDSVWLVLQYDHVETAPPDRCEAVEAATVAYWEEWAGTARGVAEAVAGDEPWTEAVIRSALICKLLINEGSGAIYAAATTSLPEAYGGERNWDYRYNWIRDAKLTVQALANLDSDAEVRDYFEWFREISHEDPGAIQPVYGVHGERDIPERTLDHLSGYRNASPVRVGNAAATQRQLDVYGTIVQGISETSQAGETLERADWESIRGLVEHASAVWDQRDRSIWEYRHEPRHYVHSKLMCWVALDRGIGLADELGYDAPVGRWEDERAAIRDAIEERGYSESAGSFVQHFETEETLDATCLLLPLYEFLPPDDPRIEGTLDAVTDRLLDDRGLVHRTAGPDAPDEGPGAFLLCSFWLVDVLVLADRVEAARDVFTGVLDHVSPPTLLSERIDTATGELLGNFPQAFSHIGLINSAIHLGSVEGNCDLAADPLENRRDGP